jgi:hypothetical protein
VLPYLIWEQPRFRQRNDLKCFFQQTTPTRALTKILMLAEHEILIFLYFKPKSKSEFTEVNASCGFLPESGELAFRIAA